MKKETVVKKIKELMSAPYDEKKLKPFMDMMSDNVENFRIGSLYIDQFERHSSQFEIITKYHSEAMKTFNSKYRQRYYSVAMMAEEADDLSMFDVEQLGEETLNDLKKTVGAIQYEM